MNNVEARTGAAKLIHLSEEEVDCFQEKRRAADTDANYVYFVDRRFGAEDFALLWDRLGLKSDNDWKAKQLQRREKEKPIQLAFVLSPPTLCAPKHTLALFNPLSTMKSKFGRAAYFADGTPIGVYPLDIILFDRLVSVLKDVYVDCEKAPGQTFPRDPGILGGFTLLSPENVFA